MGMKRSTKHGTERVGGTATGRKVSSWLRENWREYIDECGEVNATLMAEECACAFDLYGPAPDYEIPEWLFEATGEYQG